MGRALIAAAIAAFALAACGHAGDTPQSLADETTKAVYDNDLNAVQTKFDAALKRDVTLDQVNALSAKMHALGAYKGVAQTSGDPDKGRYDFAADFDGGRAAVHLRVDPGGHIAAYHVDLPVANATAASH